LYADPELEALDTAKSMKEAFDDVIREYIDFVNGQVGAYMDAIAGFAGHYVRVERQVHRVLRGHPRTDQSGRPIIVLVSYEIPDEPDVILNNIYRAEDYLSANAVGGSNEQQYAQAILVFLFTFWEDEIRPRLAAAKGVDKGQITSDIMGDLRLVRHAILHARGILRRDKHQKLKKLRSMFPLDEPVKITYDSMHQIFILIKQDLARMMIERLGSKDNPDLSKLRDFALQKGSSRPS
jgi:hypothetical protein